MTLREAQDRDPSGSVGGNPPARSVSQLQRVAMTVSVRTRFEVFKRDRFTCAYCGRTPPEVLLEVDHVVPIAAGGGDELPNLVTACATCNRGKAARLLEEGTMPVVGTRTIEEMQERIEQAQAYMEAVAGVRSLQEQQIGLVQEAWAKAFGAIIEERSDGAYYVLGRGMWPQERSIRAVLRRLPLEEVLEAVDVTAGRFSDPEFGACKYFYAICWRKVRDHGNAS